MVLAWNKKICTAIKVCTSIKIVLVLVWGSYYVPDTYVPGTPVVVVVVVVVVFTLNRSFYPTTSAVPPVSFLILHPREMQIMWSQTVRQRKTKNRGKIKVGK